MLSVAVWAARAKADSTKSILYEIDAQHKHTKYNLHLHKKDEIAQVNFSSLVNNLQHSITVLFSL